VARLAAALVPCAALTVGTRTLSAQALSGPSSFDLLPLAARAVGLGGAIVADAPGGEVVLSNPAGLAWLTRTEGALHYAKDYAANRLLATVVLPRHRVGTFAISATYVDFGAQESTPSEGQVTGQILPRGLTLGASYAASFGHRFSAGVSYRVLQFRNDCTGLCVNPSDPTQGLPAPTTAGAVDAGIQYHFAGHTPVRLGFAIRNAGPGVAVEDREQADPLPTEGSVGVRVDLPSVARSVKDTELHLLGEVGTGIAKSGLGTDVRLGAEAEYRKRFALRAGFSHRSGSQYGGPTIGFGYMGERFTFDLATQFAGFSTDAGVQPIFAAFRYWF
jgi:hypothetical protein